MRSPHLLLACALVLAPIAGVPLSATEANTPTASGSEAESPGTIKRPINNSVSHLAINSTQINETGIETVTLDVSGAVAFDGSEYNWKYRIESFDAGLKNASDRQAVVNSALNRTENRTHKLRERQKKAIKNYNDGTLSAQAFLRELAVISAEANQIIVFIKHIRPYSEWTNSHRALALKSELDTFTGSVRTNIESVLQGDTNSPKRFFVRTSAQGVVLATVDDGQYVREAYLSGARAGSNTTDSNSFNNSQSIINDSYPSFPSSIDNIDGGMKKTRNRHYKYKLPHSHGRITSFVDRPSGNVFSEHQTLSISDKRTRHGPQNTSGPFTLETNTTYTGGYMIVRLNDPKTDAEPNGTITVDGETVGTTEDGELYMLQPPNGTTINATVDGETVSVTVGKPVGPPQSGLSIRKERRDKWQQMGNILF